MNGFIIVNKPEGMTSSTVVVKARRILDFKKIGHMGTLDPLATGVLPIALGNAARLFDYFIEKKKTYRAGFVFGAATDTLDCTGKITETRLADFSENELLSALQKLTGQIEQIPPAYSAKSVGGVRSYTLARQGIETTLPPKKITVYDFKYLGESGGVYNFEITCSGGTYIRALARDLAALLGTVGHMKTLERTASGIFKIEDAVTLEELGSAKLIPATAAIADMPVFTVPEEFYKKLCDGVKMVLAGLPKERYFAVYCRGELFGIGTKDDKDRLAIKTNLRDTNEANQIL